MRAVAITPRNQRVLSLDFPADAAFLKFSQVGFRIALFEACSAFTTRYGLHLRQVAYSDPLHRRLQQIRYLLYSSDCYRLERQLPGGFRTH